MRSMKHRELAFLLVGTLAVATPAYAKDGSDDGSNGSNGNSSSGSSGSSGTSSTSSTSGSSGTSCGIAVINSSSSSSSTSGTSSTSRSSSSSNPRSKCGIALNDTLPVVKGGFKKTSGKRGSRQNLELKLEIAKNGLITQNNFDNDISALTAIFPGNVVCELAGVNQSRKTFTYLLKAKARNNGVDVRVGTCLSGVGLPLTEMPAIKRGNNIVLMFDADGNAATVNDVVEVGTVRFK